MTDFWTTDDTLSQMEKAQYKCLANNLAHHKDAGALQRPQVSRLTHGSEQE